MSDYKELVEQERERANTWQRQAGRVQSERDALQAENEKLRAKLDSMTKRHASALGAIARVRSTVMTTDGDYLDSEDFDCLAGCVQMALGPWLEVTDR